MPVALLDTNAVSDLMRDHPQVKTRVGNHRDPLATSVVVVGEIRYGLDRLPGGKKRTDLEARANKILAALRVETITLSIATAYGRLKASLTGQGLNLEDNDLWIAAIALTQGTLLVTRDQLFTRIPGTVAASNYSRLVSTSEDFLEKIAVQRCCLAFSAHTFFARILLQQTKGNTAHRRKVRSRVPAVNTAFVFPKVHVQLPMEIILDPPMTTPHFSILACTHPPATDEIAHVCGRFPVDRDFTENHSDRR